MARVRRYLIALVVVSVSLGATAACNNKAKPSGSLTIVAFGDSLTAGYGTTGDNDFVAVLAKRVNKSITNAGRYGDTTADALARIDNAVLARNPNIVIVLLGGNDLLQNLPVQQTVANMNTIVDRIRAKNAAVILVGVSDVYDPFAGALPGIASRTSSTLVPAVLDGILGNPSLMYDSVHPNNAGHQIMADRIEPALRAQISAAGG